MIDNMIDGILCIAVGICMLVAIYKAVVFKSRLWVLYGLYCGAFFLGSLWWVLYLGFFSDNNPISLIPYNDWNVANLFLIMILELCLGKNRVRRSAKILWFIPVFVTAMCLYYMTLGSYINNTITAVLMGILMWKAVGGLLYIRRYPQEADPRNEDLWPEHLLQGPP